MVGLLLGNRYKIIEKIGGGGMAVVYKAQCTFLERTVAIKVLRSEFADDEEFLKQFKREGRAAASLSHPNIVSIYDVGQQDNIHYIVMEFIPGQTLKDLIRREGFLTVSETLRITTQILDALDHAHRNGIVHRDIKPQNIMLDGKRVKVADFGIARSVGTATIEYTEKVLGTAHYFSPEQARGIPAGARSDLYSLGVVMYEMLTGRLPFTGETPVSVAMKHINGDFLHPRRLNPAIPEPLEDILLKALKKIPEYRYQSAREMLKDLAAFDEGRTVDTFTHEDDSKPDTDAGDTRVMPPARSASLTQGNPEAQGDRAAVSGKGSRSRQVLTRVLVVVLTLALLSGAAYGAWFIWDWLNVPEVLVPDVARLHITEAERTLAAAGLDASVVDERTSDEIPVNYVISQDPPPEEAVKQGRTVRLIISKGPEWVEGGVPGVIGLPEKQGILELEKVGLEPNVVKEFSDEVEEGLIIDQNPRSGIPVQRGTQVELKVSLGPAPQPVTLPDYTGLPLDQVLNGLEELGLSQGQIVREKGQYPLGRIIAQEPKPGAVLSTGDPVDLTVSLGCQNETTVFVNILATAEPSGHLRVDVIDQLPPPRTAYEGNHAAGDRFPVKVCWVGEAARVRVFYNDKIMDSEFIYSGR